MALDCYTLISKAFVMMNISTTLFVKRVQLLQMIHTFLDKGEYRDDMMGEHSLIVLIILKQGIVMHTMKFWI